jgi:hypothetical protein
MADNVPQIATAWDWAFKLVDATDGYTPETGKSPAVTISKDGAAFGGLTGSPAVTEIGNGWYVVTVPAADMASLVILHAEAAGCRNADECLWPAGDWIAYLCNDRTFDRTTRTLSLKASDGVTERFALQYAKVSNDVFKYGRA